MKKVLLTAFFVACSVSNAMAAEECPAAGYVKRFTADGNVVYFTCDGKRLDSVPVQQVDVDVKKDGSTGTAVP